MWPKYFLYSNLPWIIPFICHFFALFILPFLDRCEKHQWWDICPKVFMHSRQTIKPRCLMGCQGMGNISRVRGISIRQREVVQLCLEEQLLRFLENFRDKAHQQLFENPLRLKLSLPVWIYFFLLLLLPLWALFIFHMHTLLEWGFEHTKWASQMKECMW